MHGKISFTRNADYLYRINEHERRSMYAGLTSDNRQVLMCLFCPNLVAIFFDREGNLLDVQQRLLTFMVEDAERGVGTNISDERIEAQLLAWQEELGYVPAPINVHKFFVLNEIGSKEESAWHREGIGIVDFPAHFHDTLANPSKYTDDEKQEVLDGLTRWEQRGQFVLWWGNDLWFDKTGECVAS